MATDLSGYMNNFYGGQQSPFAARPSSGVSQNYPTITPILGAPTDPNMGSPSTGSGGPTPVGTWSSSPNEGVPSGSNWWNATTPLQYIQNGNQGAPKVQPVPTYQQSNPTQQSGSITGPNGMTGYATGTPWNANQYGDMYGANGNYIGNNGGSATGTYTPPPGTQTAVGPQTATTFGDPAYQQLNQLVADRLKQLQGGANFPQVDQLTSMLQQNETAAKQRAQTLADQLTARIGQLQTPLLSTADVANQNALASNNLLGQRDTALANARANLAARGIDPNSSGLATDQQNQIAQNYNNRQGSIDAQLREQQIQGDEQRRNEAANLQGLVQQALQGGDLTAIQNQAQAADLENQLYNINQNRSREALTTGQIPVDLTNQGYSNALNASSGAGNPLQSIMSLLQLANQQQGIQQQGTNSNMAGLGFLLQMLTQ